MSRNPLLFATFISLFLQSCSGDFDRLASYEQSIDTSPEGMAHFFSEECLKQGGAQRARAAYQRAKKICGAADSECLENIPHEVSWKVIASDKTELEVIYDWRGLESSDPPGGILGCSIAVPDRLQRNLRNAIPFLRMENHGFTLSKGKYARALIDTIESWDSDAPPSGRFVLTFQHYGNQADQMGSPASNGTFEHDSYTRGLNDANVELDQHRDRPWILKFGIAKNQP